VERDPALTKVATLGIFQASSGNILLTGIAHHPCFGQREQSMGEDTSTSWKVLFARRSVLQHKKLSNKMCIIWFGKHLTFYLPLRDIFFCNE